MITGKKVLGLVPARGGSRGLPRKNLRQLAGRPLLEWTAAAGLDSEYLDDLVLSTDDDEIARVGDAAGMQVRFRRPASAATDEALASQVVTHALGVLPEEYDLVVYLQPTSPLRTAADIDGAIEALVEANADFCVSVHPSPERPDLMFYLDPEDRIVPVTGTFVARRRQDVPPCYVINGAVYVAGTTAFLEHQTFIGQGTVAYRMPTTRGLDIDDLADFERAEAILRGASGMVN